VTEARVVRQLAPGLWHWRAPHPDWSAGEPWDRAVSSYAIDHGGALLLFDPIAPPPELEALADEREAAIVLTAPWHERDTRSLVERLRMPVYTPLPDTAHDLMRMYGITAEQAGDGSPDLVWLLKEGIGDARVYAAGDRLEIGVEAFPGQKPNDLVLWIESHRAVVAGDTLADLGDGLAINPRWLGPDVTREQVVEGLRPLLQKPVEHMLATHGGPYERDALELALSPRS
jgi:glyoxylase-like metal-dependent hydrolase (beta-lactamase superfamily II)